MARQRSAPQIDSNYLRGAVAYAGGARELARASGIKWGTLQGLLSGRVRAPSAATVGRVQAYRDSLSRGRKSALTRAVNFVNRNSQGGPARQAYETAKRLSKLPPDERGKAFSRGTFAGEGAPVDFDDTPKRDSPSLRGRGSLDDEDEADAGEPYNELDTDLFDESAA